jgi:hypothetical protein
MCVHLFFWPPQHDCQVLQGWAMVEINIETNGVSNSIPRPAPGKLPIPK